MRKRRLLLAAGATLATLALTVGTALADPPSFPAPPPAGTIIGVGAQTTQGVFNDLCNNNKVSPVTCASYDIPPPSGNITTKPTPPAACTFTRPNSGGPGFQALIDHPTCVDFARVVTDGDKTTRPTGFTYIPFATDALTYAFRGDGTVPPDLSDADLHEIYNCNPAFVTGPNAFKPLIGTVGAGNRTLFLARIGVADPPPPCVQQGFLANDGRVLTDPRQLITYSSAPYFAQLNQVEPDQHGAAVLGGINGIPPEVLNDESFISRPVFNVVRNADVPGPGNIHDLFVGPTSKVCTNTTTIKQHGFNTRPAAGPLACGDTTDVTTN
jgi:hypothetical protein